MSVAVLNAMNTRGRAAICGAISHYNEVILMLRVLMLMLRLMLNLRLEDTARQQTYSPSASSRS